MTFRERVRGIVTRHQSEPSVAESPASKAIQSAAEKSGSITSAPDDTSKTPVITPVPADLAQDERQHRWSKYGNNDDTWRERNYKRIGIITGGVAAVALTGSLAAVFLTGSSTPTKHNGAVPSAVGKGHKHKTVPTTSTTTSTTTTTTKPASNVKTKSSGGVAAVAAPKIVTSSAGGSVHKTPATTTTTAPVKTTTPTTTTTTTAGTTTTTTSTTSTTTTTTTPTNQLPPNCSVGTISTAGLQKVSLTVGSNQTSGQFQYDAFAYTLKSGDNLMFMVSQQSYSEICSATVGSNGIGATYIYLPNPKQSFIVTVTDNTANTYAQSTVLDFNGAMRK